MRLKQPQIIPCPPDAAAELVRLIGICCPKCGGYVSGDNAIGASHICKCGWKPPHDASKGESPEAAFAAKEAAYAPVKAKWMQSPGPFHGGWQVAAESVGWQSFCAGVEYGKTLRESSGTRAQGEVTADSELRQCAEAVRDIEEYLFSIYIPVEGTVAINDLVNRVKRAVRSGGDHLMREISNALDGQPKLNNAAGEYLVTAKVRELVAEVTRFRKDSTEPFIVSDECKVPDGHNYITVGQLRQRMLAAESRASLAETHVAALQKELANKPARMCDDSCLVQFDDQTRCTVVELKRSVTALQNQIIKNGAPGWRLPQRGDKVRLVRLPPEDFDQTFKIGDVFNAVSITTDFTGRYLLSILQKPTHTAAIYLPLQCFERVTEAAT